MKKKGKNSSYLKAITTLMSGSIVAQIFTLICSPILTRICSAEIMGVYSLVTGAVTMFGMVMSLRYELCIVYEPEEKNVYPLIKLSVFLCAGLSVLITIGYLIYFHAIDVEENFVVLAVITGLLVFLMGLINIVTAYNNRQRDYKLINKTYVTRIFSQNICNLIAGSLGLGAAGLSFSQLLGYLAGVRGQAKPMLQHWKEIVGATAAEMKAVAVSNKRQAVISAPATLGNGLSYSLISYFIEALFTTANVGYYSISYRLLGLPITIISTNVSRVFLEKASREYQEVGNFKSTYKSTVGMLSVMAIPIGAALMLLGPWACELVFGDGWGVAGEYIRLLTPMFMLRFVAGGVNCAAIIVNKQQYDFLIQMLLTVSVVVVFILSSVLKWEIEMFLFVLNAAFSVIYVAYLLIFWHCAKSEGK